MKNSTLNSTLKRILSSTLALTLVATTAPKASATSFSDVSSGDWFYDYVISMAEKGLVKGNEGFYSPQSTLSVAEFAVMIANGFYADTLAEEQSKNPSNWWFPYLSACHIRNGLTGTTAEDSSTWATESSSKITRYDMAVMIFNLLQDRNISTLSSEEVPTVLGNLSDSIPEAYQQAVATAYDYGFISGKEGGNFDGSATLTRAEAAVVLSALVNCGFIEDIHITETEVTTTPSTTTPSTPSTSTPSSGISSNLSTNSIGYIGQANYTFHYHSLNKYVFDESWPTFQALANRTGITFTNTGNPVATNSDTEIVLESLTAYPSDLYGGNLVRDYVMRDGPEATHRQGTSKNIFYAISDYWHLFPNFRAYLDANPEVERSITSTDGKIYYIPQVDELEVGKGYFIRQDWLKNLGLATPTTTGELEQVLIAFRDDDPNGNGLKDEIPYFNDKGPELFRLVNLWGARCYASEGYDQRVVPNAQGQLYHAWTTDEFRTGVTNISRWYDEGLIDPDIFIKGNTARPEYLAGDLGGVTYDMIGSTASYNETVTVPEFQFVAMAPPVSTLGTQWSEHELNSLSAGWAVSTSCTSPEALFSFMDSFWTVEGYLYGNYGIEGEQYSLNNGYPQFYNSVVDGTATGNKVYDTYLMEDVGAQLQIGYLTGADFHYQATNEIGKAALNLYSQYTTTAQLPNLSYTKEEQKILDPYNSRINNHLDTIVQSWITGDYTKITDEVWNAHLLTMEQLGVNELIAVYQSAYNRHYYG